MKTELRNMFRSIAAVLSVVILTTQLAQAAQMDAGAQAAAQATAAAQQATQQAQQAMQQATAAAQQANAQAMANAQAAAADTQTAPAPIQRPAPVPLAPNAPVPAQIAAAHTVFLTNSGADANFPVDETQAYNDVYAAFQSWGHYQFVASPAQADLIFQLHDVAPITDVTGGRGGVYSLSSPAFQLTIVDPRTNTSLWTVTSPVNVTGSKSTRARWFALSVANLISRVKVLANVPLTPTETADLTTVPKYHGMRTALIVTSVAVGLGVAGALIAIHEAKNSQDAFCNAHNIPLSMCASG
jgi:hypothetical protein